MKRLAFSIVSATSLLLLAGTIGLWAYSYVRPIGWLWCDGVRVPTAGYMVAWRKAVLSERGGLFYLMDRSMGGVRASRVIMQMEAQFLPRVDDAHRVLGIGYQSRSGYPTVASNRSGPPAVISRVWMVPYWLFLILFAPLPPTWFVALRRLSRAGDGGPVPRLRL